METKDYTVTELAGPYVAGRQAKKDDTLPLTEAQAETELLSGAIVLKDAKAQSFEGSKHLPDIQARAKGFDGAKEAAQAEPETPPADPPGDDAGKGKPGGRKPAAATPAA